jgi:hypothetical protein
MSCSVSLTVGACPAGHNAPTNCSDKINSALVVAVFLPYLAVTYVASSRGSALPTSEFAVLVAGALHYLPGQLRLPRNRPAALPLAASHSPKARRVVGSRLGEAVE